MYIKLSITAGYLVVLTLKGKSIKSDYESIFIEV